MIAIEKIKSVLWLGIAVTLDSESVLNYIYSKENQVTNIEDSIMTNNNICIRTGYFWKKDIETIFKFVMEDYGIWRRTNYELYKLYKELDVVKYIKINRLIGVSYIKGGKQAKGIRRIFGPKRDENGKLRRLHNEELHSLYVHLI